MVFDKGRWLRISALILLVCAAGCAGAPVREAVKIDTSVPVGKIEGNQFTGIRYPFKVSAPQSWTITTEYPQFMLDLGFEKEGLEESQVFVYNPATQSNLQIDFSPAGRHSTFDQKKIEWMTTAAMGSFQEELQKDYGKNIQVEISPLEPYSLKGVPYAAKIYATYVLKGIKREQGWIYAFSEPYQIFILYMILDKEGANDHQSVKTILNSFEFTPPKP
jgi:hypothetical protein